MNPIESVSGFLAAVTEPYGSEIRGKDLVYLSKLALSIRVQIHGHQRYPSGEMLIVHYTASGEGQTQGIEVTCVGMGADTDHAVRESLANYAGNVIPVLEQWRTRHNCLADVSEVELVGKSGVLRFEAIGGPLTCRGLPDLAGDHAPIVLEGYVPRIAMELAKSPVPNRLHWLECFAGRQLNGDINATCRLDNRDWRPGRQLLEADAQTWPITGAPLTSRRQFIMLVPLDPGNEEPERRSFFSRWFKR